ncbi:MAG: glucose-1-phosphate thymidylyltransferase [Planctomycetes bacterium]|nr:glucose-1-phosphate thymidylyltransferase [Planctomycetota bacterium]
MNFAPDEFFDLEDFAHAELLAGVEPIWQMLGRPLAEYIASHIKPEIQGTVMDGAWLMGNDIYIGEGTVVEPGAMIKGPAIIGRNCEIRHTAYIREDVIVGDNSIVGHATELKGCVLMDHVEAGHFAYIGDSVVGNHAMLGAGTKLANFKVDSTKVVVRDGDVQHPTGLEKFGAIVGDGTKFGCNTVSYPGTLLGKGCVILPCRIVRGCVPAGTVIRD